LVRAQELLTRFAFTAKVNDKIGEREREREREREKRKRVI